MLHTTIVFVKAVGDTLSDPKLNDRFSGMMRIA